MAKKSKKIQNVITAEERKAIHKELKNLRETYRRRATALEKASKLTMNMGEGAEYMRAAEALRKEASDINMKSLQKYHDFRKQTRKQTVYALTESMLKFTEAKKQRISYIPAQKPAEILRSEALSNVQYKYASKEITVFTYGSVWDTGDSKEERQRKIREEVVNGLKKQGINVSEETLTTSMIMNYYRDIIREFTGDENFQFADSPFGESYYPGKYAKELESGYSAYLGKKKYERYEREQITARASEVGKRG